MRERLDMEEKVDNGEMVFTETGESIWDTNLNPATENYN